MYDSLRTLFKEEIEGEIDEAKNKARQEGLLETIKNLMTNMKWTADQAMEAMSILAEKRSIYKAKL